MTEMTAKNKHPLCPLIFLVLMLSAIIQSTSASVECYCSFDGKPVMSLGETMKNCVEQCGRVVGGQTECGNDCEECCESWCSRVGEKESKLSCVTSCTKTCDLKKFMGDLISLIYVLSGIVAVVMVVFHGIRLISADDAKKRDVAKKSLMYLVIALIIIGIGGIAINALLKGVIQPARTETIETVEGCGGTILNVREEIQVDEMTLSISFTNNGDKTCYYRVGIYDSKGSILGMSPANIGQLDSSEVFVTSSGEIKTAQFIISSENLQDGYSIMLFLCNGELPFSSSDCLYKQDKYTYSGLSRA